MGAFHAGHVSLFEAARRECDTVVVSLFVNPTQFGEKADLERYPRNETNDREIAERAGVDVALRANRVRAVSGRVRHVGRRPVAESHPRGCVPSRPFSRRRHDLPEAV